MLLNDLNSLSFNTANMKYIFTAENNSNFRNQNPHICPWENHNAETISVKKEIKGKRLKCSKKKTTQGLAVMAGMMLESEFR